MSVTELKNHIRGHGKIYVRPLQRSFSTALLAKERNESKNKSKNSICSDIFYVKELRKDNLTLRYFRERSSDRKFYFIRFHPIWTLTPELMLLSNFAQGVAPAKIWCKY